ncbi:MAG: hypothetical protein LBM06_06520 [Prevotellaceae bacterium]|jgi:hypothetical protein|nr:hypothetical protein [Prevotellaceae bacterium]
MIATMIKKHLLLLAFLLGALAAGAQTIHFSVGEIQGDEALSAPVKQLLQTKIEQIVTRNSAGASSAYNPFVIESVLQIADKKKSTGLTRNVTLVKGELTLIVRNYLDNSMYYSTVVSLTGNAFEGEDPYKSMVNSMKSTDPVYTRFIRIARQKIEEYYATNCSAVMQKAQSLADLKQYHEAIAYLSVIPETVPCFEQSAALLKSISGKLPQEELPDTIVIERVVEKPVIVEKPAPAPPPVETPQPEVEAPQITVSRTDFQFKVIRCYGDRTMQRIVILAEMMNNDTNRTSNESLHFRQCITDAGTELTSFEMQNNSYYVQMPPRVPITREFYVTKVFDPVAKLAYVELTIGRTTVTIRNLTVEWNE